MKRYEVYKNETFVCSTDHVENANYYASLCGGVVVDLFKD